DVNDIKFYELASDEEFVRSPPVVHLRDRLMKRLLRAYSGCRKASLSVSILQLCCSVWVCTRDIDSAFASSTSRF
ncbi:hypothetical protein FRC18_002039, partial [Serendipita sp. 400]